MKSQRDKTAPTNAIVRALARGYTPTCLAALLQLAQSDEECFHDRMEAISVLIRIGHGRAMWDGVEQDAPQESTTPAQKIDALWQSQFMRALAGDVAAIDACLRIIEQQQPALTPSDNASDVQAIRAAALRKARAFFAREGAAGATEQ